MDSKHFAIGYMRGTMWAFMIGAWISIGIGIYLQRSIYLWIGLILELLVPPVWAMKNALEANNER